MLQSMGQKRVGYNLATEQQPKQQQWSVLAISPVTVNFAGS